MMRLARSYDEAVAGEERAIEFRRLANAVLKYWLNKRAPTHAAEALECFGGNGYVEESAMPRLYREVPLNSIWEGSGNVQCLDVLRGMAKNPGSVEAFFAEVAEAAGSDERLDLAAAELREELTDLEAIESRARRIVEWMALVLQGSLLLRFGDEAVADAFCASRLGGDAGRAFGTLPPGTDFKRIIERHAAACRREPGAGHDRPRRRRRRRAADARRQAQRARPGDVQLARRRAGRAPRRRAACARWSSPATVPASAPASTSRRSWSRAWTSRRSCSRTATRTRRTTPSA